MIKPRTITDFDDLILDPNNPNKGTARGRYMLEQSFEQVGGARSAVADAAGVIRAGNHATEVAHEKGLKPVIVPITGDQFVIVQRVDLEPSDPRTRLLTYYDNRAGQVGYAPDPAVFLSDVEQGLDLSDMYKPEEITAVVRKAQADERETFKFLDKYAENQDEAAAAGKSAPPVIDAYPLAIVLDPDQYKKWQDYKTKIGLRNDTRAFMHLLGGEYGS